MEDIDVLVSDESLDKDALLVVNSTGVEIV
ncbi:hypothetical protein SDC9_188477 [bioreactor metagenome]|uniref:Uncharacterized protein n=1 Tax=bioreactor metagenome TaxID=1076179 RepID=A0A645HPP7_9ZZZZ